MKRHVHLNLYIRRGCSTIELDDIFCQSHAPPPPLCVCTHSKPHPFQDVIDIGLSFRLPAAEIRSFQPSARSYPLSLSPPSVLHDVGGYCIYLSESCVPFVLLLYTLLVTQQVRFVVVRGNKLMWSWAKRD